MMNERLGPIRERPARSPWVWVGLGCGGLVVVSVGLTAAIFAFVSGMFRSSGAYQEALAEARQSPAVQEALGQPIEPGWWFTGSIETSGPSGEASFAFPISGPKGSGRVFVEATRRAGRWNHQLLQVELPSGERIDLLEQAGDDGA